mmetsp:Transcript_95609/g.274425  ORF Transcript_95609/g.274425 Transcript_95609/m.274425 type:complete len:1124 (+) Transcript_95609:115-3486(+)
MPRRTQRRACLGLLEFFACLWAASVFGTTVAAACPFSCSSHGVCKAGFCECDAGYAGEDCSYFLSGSEDDEDGVEAEGGEYEERLAFPGALQRPSHRSVAGIQVTASAPDLNGGRGAVAEIQVQDQRATVPEPTRAATQADEAQVGDAACDPPCALATGRCASGRCYCALGFGGVHCSQLVAGLAQQGSKSEPGPATAFDPKALDMLEQQVQGMEKQLAVLGSGQDATTEAVQGDSASVRSAMQAVEQSAERMQASVEQSVPAAARAVDASNHTPAQVPAAPPLTAGVAAQQRQHRPQLGGLAMQHHVKAPGLPAPSSVTGMCSDDCNGHGTCTKVGSALKCDCDDGWEGDACDMPACPSDCNSNGMCVMGKCVCNAGFQGVSCDQLRCPDDCSGSGYCFEGACHCSSGFGGANCALVAPTGQKFSLKLRRGSSLKVPKSLQGEVETATLRDAAVRACPQDCSGRGACSSEGMCDCMAGYAGSACESFCPNECSHQGDCIEGACLCFAGFMGEDCAVVSCCSGHGSCDDPDSCVCEAGWGGDDCSIKLLCADPTCSGHGSCKEGSCFCEPGFGGSTCATPAGGCDPPCGQNGMCNPESKNCDCKAGFTGKTCDLALQSCPNFCNNKGLCMNGECMCGAGWGGADCSQRHFAPGEKASDLTPPQNAVGIGAGGPLSGLESDGLAAPASFLAVSGNGTSPRVRKPARSLRSLLQWGDSMKVRRGSAMETVEGNARASSQLQQRRGGPIDSIIGGIAGLVGFDSPEEVAAKRIAGDGQVCGEGGLCSGHGACNVSFGKCECTGLWRESDCSVEGCPGFLETGKDCNGKGVCQAGVCTCSAGWGLTPGNNGSNYCQDAVCPVPCSEHGICDNGMCRCSQGWMGPNCRDPQCSGDCSGRGICGQPSPNSPGECTCNYGWAGSACERAAMYETLAACPLDCSGNGLCMNGMCACNVGFSGSACSEVACAPGYTGPACDIETCANDCNGKGLCFKKECVCLSGFTGHDCAMPVRCYEACRHVCELGPGGVVPAPERCSSCVGSCSTAAMNPPLGMHSPFSDLEATLLQVHPSSPLAAADPPAGAAGPATALVQRRQPRRRHREVSAAAVGSKRKQHNKHRELSAVRLTQQ